MMVFISSLFHLWLQLGFVTHKPQLFPRTIHLLSKVALTHFLMLFFFRMVLGRSYSATWSGDPGGPQTMLVK